MKKVIVLLQVALMCALTYMVLAPCSANAAGFALYEWDNRANGMGGAVIASQDPRPSTVAYNPAGMVNLEGIQAQAGVTFLAPSAHVEIEASSPYVPGMGGEERSVDTKDRVFTVPHIYITGQLTDDIWLGFGEFTRFGLGTHYDHSWAGRGNVYKANMETFSFQPSVAYKVNEELAFGFGLEFLYGRMDLRTDHRAINAALNEWKMFPEGYGTAWNLSALWTPKDWFSMGLVYRHQFKFFGTGDAEFTNSAANDTFKLRADFPGSWTWGVAVKPCDDLTIEADFIYTMWGSFRKLEYQVSDTTKANALDIADNDFDSLKNYSNTIRIQLGAEWEAWDGVFLRGGYIYDDSPQNTDYMDYMLPSNDRSLVTSGLGLELGDLTLDFSLMYLWAKEYGFNNSVTGTAPTRVSDVKCWMGGLSFSYSF